MWPRGLVAAHLVPWVLMWDSVVRSLLAIFLSFCDYPPAVRPWGVTERTNRVADSGPLTFSPTEDGTLGTSCLRG